MAQDAITYHPIGTVNSAFESPGDVPKHADDVVDASGTVTIREEYLEGLAEIEGFSHLLLITHLHLAGEPTMRCDPPFVEGIRPGIFATRGPRRPNPIGVTIVRLTGVDGNELAVDNLDLVDRTPVIDIKPFAPKRGVLDGLEGGWLESETNQSFAAYRPESE